jgi:hypothetical protein
MNRDFELLDVDRITAEMYGVIFPSQHIPPSKNEMDILDELDEEIDSVLDMIDFEFFAPSKEKFWENNLL